LGDIVELATYDWISRTMLLMALLLPVASLYVALRRDRRAWLSVTLSAMLFLAWFSHHANPEWSMGGPQGVASLSLASPRVGLPSSG
jgi:hypothetical protein